MFWWQQMLKALLQKQSRVQRVNIRVLVMLQQAQ
jgi:hypothetical protein